MLSAASKFKNSNRYCVAFVVVVIQDVATSSLQACPGMPQATGSSRNVTDLAAPKYIWGLYLIFQHVCISLLKYVRYCHFLVPKAFSMIIIKIMDRCVVLQNVKFSGD